MSNSNNTKIITATLSDSYDNKHNIIINEEDFFFSYVIQNNYIDFIVNNSTNIEFFSFDIFDISNIAYSKEELQIQISTKNTKEYLFFNTDKIDYGELISVNLLKAISDFKSKKTSIQSL